MTIVSAAAFFDKALADKGLQEKIVAAAAAAKEPTEKAAAVVKLGQSMGFEFTPAEAIALRAATRKALIGQGTMDGQLDDLDLQVVTGGSSWMDTIISKAGGTFAGANVAAAANFAKDYMLPGMSNVPFGGILGGIVSAGVAGGISSVMNGGGAEDFFTGFGNGVVSTANKAAGLFTDPVGTLESIFSGW